MLWFRSIKLIFLFVLLANIAVAQEKYWVDQIDVDSPGIAEILPVSEFCSEWLAACSFRLDTGQYQELIRQGIHPSRVLSLTTASEMTGQPLLGFALEQIEAEVFAELGLNGQGVKIGIIDGGFLKANKDNSLKHFFENELVKSYKDYITPDMAEYGGATGLDDNHGTEVWQLIGGFNSDKNIQFGLATSSEYYLARTDHGAYEKRIEEDYLIQAMEDMEKEGVKLINISLGYNIGFKSPEANYKVRQMDGKTTKLAKAVDYAALNKGMLIVVAAGNDAKTKWKIIDTPADAQFALTVGASKFKIWDKMNYSSIGPDFTDFVKPDVSVYSTLGTSYSTPVVTGMAACLWQLKPELTNFEIIDAFKRAGNFYPYPNNYLGYGVPTASNLIKVINGDTIPKLKPIQTRKAFHKISVDENMKYIVAFHKKDDRNVINRVVYRPKKKSGKNQKNRKRHAVLRPTRSGCTGNFLGVMKSFCPFFNPLFVNRSNSLFFH